MILYNESIQKQQQQQHQQKQQPKTQQNRSKMKRKQYQKTIGSNTTNEQLKAETK